MSTPSTPRLILVTPWALVFLAACQAPGSATETPGPAAPLPQISNEPIQPLPLHITWDGPRVALGKRLFEDPMLSKDGSMSCQTCHPLSRGGADGHTRSIKVDGKETATNTPTMFNLVFNFRYQWAGSYSTLETQLDVPLGRSMSSTLAFVKSRLETSQDYRDAFARVFPDGMTETNIRDAIVAFERTLVTPNARFDRYLRGDQGAITAQEKHGYALFKHYGCVNCHQGQNVGGNMWQLMGVMEDYFAQRQELRGDGDLGRYAVTHDEADLHVFRVPSLRNVELTAPYLHDGSVKDLTQAVRIMARYQLGVADPPQEDVAALVAFLHTLTGETPEVLR